MKTQNYSLHLLSIAKLIRQKDSGRLLEIGVITILFMLVIDPSHHRMTGLT